MRLCHFEVDQQLRHDLRAHASATIGVQGQRAWFDALFANGFSDQLFGRFSAFSWRGHPADDLAAEDVEDHIQVEIAPLEQPA